MDIKQMPARVCIRGIQPEIDAGRYPIKRVIGERVCIEADVFAEGHDQLAGVLQYRKEGETSWNETVLEPLVNDRWRAEFTVSELGRYEYTLEAWIDRFGTWRHDLEKRVAAGQDVKVELQIGAQLIREAGQRAKGSDRKRLADAARKLEPREPFDLDAAITSALDAELNEWMRKYPARESAAKYPKMLTVTVDPPKALFSAWYEMFPRSIWGEQHAHGTLRDVIDRLSTVAEMGFDVLYFPPIHPIGRSYRKGRNNEVNASLDDPGSPWGIGAEEGGHKAIHPQLGTMEDFRELARRARGQGIDIALDVAFQCSPDHPYVSQHPEWFRKRPDGSIQYAENPPKKYQDIYPFEFETSAWRELWEELKSVFEFWIEQGVRIFRVDNPHTKPLAFWEWLIGDLKKQYPDLIFLAEAFTRPKMMYELAKVGFTQSYTYFAWRNTRWEIERYFEELTRTEAREFFRPNLWPNTPDILTEYLQSGGKPSFMIRLLLAATLGANYGIYGPAFECCENMPREPGSEEYLNSEKYEIRHWDIGRAGPLRDLIARVNQIRRGNPALQSDRGLRFHSADNEQLICFSKSTDDLSNQVLVVVNLDPHHTHSGWVDLPFDELQVDPNKSYQMHDLLSGARYLWQGGRNYVELDPRAIPAHIFRLRKYQRTERDFDYYF